MILLLDYFYDKIYRWVEVWQRKKRQYLCGSSPSLTPSLHKNDYTCKHTDDDLRLTICGNKHNQSFIDVLKADIECGWSSAATIKEYDFFWILMVNLILFLLY